MSVNIRATDEHSMRLDDGCESTANEIYELLESRRIWKRVPIDLCFKTQLILLTKVKSPQILKNEISMAKN
jgi:hypothetical protein